MDMKKIMRALLAAVALFGASTANAQYYEIANQLPGLIQPALQGGFNYKGFVEMSGTAGIGNSRANFVGISTSQGFKYADWFFMGVGLGVDVAIAHRDDSDYTLDPDHIPDYWSHSSSTTKCMIPVFTDFRFNIGSSASVGAFIDLKVGAAWLLGNSYLQTNGVGCVSNSTQFYLKPTIGLRIPIDNQHTNRAFNIGVTYQLLTSNNNYYWYDNSVTLNNLGVTICYEW